MSRLTALDQDAAAPWRKKTRTNDQNLFVVFTSKQSKKNEKRTFSRLKTFIKMVKKYCCVVDCHNYESTGNVSFHRFPIRDPEQRELWIKAVNRINPDKTPWKPTKYDRICSVHFTDGKPNIAPTHPSYVPSIFPTNHRKPKKKDDYSRHERRQIRMRIPATVTTNSTASCYYTTFNG